TSIRGAATNAGFRPTKPVIEVCGLCEACSRQTPQIDQCLSNGRLREGRADRGQSVNARAKWRHSDRAICRRASLRGYRLGLGRSHIGVEFWLGDAEHRANLGDRHRVLVVEPDGQVALVLAECGRPATLLAASAGCGETGLGPLADQVALELRQCPEQVEEI